MLTNNKRAAYGHRACTHGDPDHAKSDVFTTCTDTIANVLHYLYWTTPTADIESVLRDAVTHFEAERDGLD